MPANMKLTNPWLVAVWPGMGHVAISAGFYLMAKLEMHLLAEFSARELFEIGYVEVEEGLIHQGRLPRSRLFAWIDPQRRRDLIIFIGEAQPPLGKYAFCRRLIDYAQHSACSASSPSPPWPRPCTPPILRAFSGRQPTRKA